MTIGMVGLDELNEVMEQLPGALVRAQAQVDCKGMSVLYVRPVVISGDRGLRLPLENYRVEFTGEDDSYTDGNLTHLSKENEFEVVAAALYQMGRQLGQGGKLVEYAIFVMTALPQVRGEAIDADFLLLAEGILLNGGSIIKSWGYKNGTTTPVDITKKGRTLVESVIEGIYETHPLYTGVN